MAKRVKRTAKRVKAPKPQPKGSKGRNMTGLVKFAKGNPGKPKGAKNKFGLKLKEAIIEAAERSGSNGKGKDGMVGYLVWLSRSEPAVYGRMLEKVMPLQVDVKDTTNKMSAPEAVAKLRERGLPVPPALEALAKGVAVAHTMQEEQDYEDELNGVGLEDESDETAQAEEAEDEGTVNDERKRDKAA